MTQDKLSAFQTLYTCLEKMCIRDRGNVHGVVVHGRVGNSLLPGMDHYSVDVAQQHCALRRSQDRLAPSLRCRLYTSEETRIRRTRQEVSMKQFSAWGFLKTDIKVNSGTRGRVHGVVVHARK